MDTKVHQRLIDLIRTQLRAQAFAGSLDRWVPARDSSGRLWLIGWSATHQRWLPIQVRLHGEAIAVDIAGGRWKLHKRTLISRLPFDAHAAIGDVKDRIAFMAADSPPIEMEIDIDDDLDAQLDAAIQAFERRREED